MNNNANIITEAQIRKAVGKAFKQLLKNISNLPTLIIELPEKEYSVSKQSLDDILEWLFGRR
jgi:hypothetical protein